MNYTNVIFIDTSVKDYHVFVDSVNENTFPLVYSSNTTRNEIIEILQPFTKIDRLAIANEQNSFFFETENIFSNLNTQFLITLINQYQIKNIDFLACSTLTSQRYTNFYSLLKETGVTVGASDNNTGNIKYGGDWIMESTHEDIEQIYFTNSIEYYNYLLVIPVFMMVIKTDGFLWGTGNNGAGQLGDGTNTNKSTFVKITTLTTPKFIALGNGHTIVLMTDGTLWSAGLNNKGQLGLGNTTNMNTFQQITLGISGRTIKSISCGIDHTIVLMTDGTLWGTGDNTNGQLALGTYTNITSFQQMNTYGLVPDKIFCGFNNTMVIMTDGTLWCSGLNYAGQFGIENTTRYNTFVQSGLTSVKTLSAANDSAIAALTNGSLYGAGAYPNIAMNIANGFNTIYRPITINVAGKIASQLSSGGPNHTLVLMTDGTLWGTGLNFDGQLGIGNNQTQRTFQPITQNIAGKTIKQIAAGDAYSSVLMTDGTLWVAGYNGDGRTGMNANANFLVQSLTNVLAIAGYMAEYTVNTTPTATSFTPGFGTRNTSVTLTGTNLSNTTSVLFGLVNASINLVTGTSVNVSAPANTGNVSVVLRDNLGNNASMPGNFAYQNPTVSSISPLVGTANSALTITGLNLMNTSFVRIQGASVPFTINSSLSLSATVNASSGNASVVVTDNVGNNASFSGNFVYQNPGATSFTPGFGTTNTSVTLTGTNLSNTTSVLFGLVNASINLVTGTSVNVSAPANTGNVSVVLRDNLGNNASMPLNFVYQNPNVSNVTPLVGTTNTALTITGLNLMNTSFVRIQGASVPFTINSSLSLSATVNASSGNASVVVTDNVGNNTSFSGNFLYQNPEATSFTPGFGTTNTSVTLTGTNLSNTTSVLFGIVNASINLVTGTSVNVSAPANTGNVSVVLRDNLGNNASMPLNFDYQNPVVSSFNPITSASNSSLTISGSNLSNTTYVLFGNVSAPINLVTGTNVNVSVPSNVGNVSVVLIDNLGNNTSAPDNFTYQNLIVNAITPTFGPKNTRITITGEKLNNTSFVKIGGLNASFTINSSTSINASTPNTSGNVSVVVVDNYANNIYYSGLYSYRNVNISSVSPLVGTTKTSVTITGTTLTNTSFVKFGDINVSISRVTASTINISVPANTGNVSILLIDNDGNNIYHPSNFVYQNPTILSINPVTGTKNTIIALTGENLMNISGVKIASKNTTFTINSSTSLNISAPNMTDGTATLQLFDNMSNQINYSGTFIYRNTSVTGFSPSVGTKNISVTLFGSNLSNTSVVTFGQNSAPINLITGTSVNVSAPAGSGNVSIVVKDAFGNNVSMPGNFLYQNPTVTGLLPLAGTTNSLLTITGSNLSNTSFVKIQGFSVPFIRNSSISLTATVNASSGNASIVVVDNLGNNTSFAGNFFYQNPTIISGTPLFGTRNTSVTLTGTNLANTSRVFFGLVNASIILLTGTRINVKVPINSGNVSIVVRDKLGNDVSLANNFVYQNPTVTSISPAKGTKNEILTITGLNLSNISFVRLNNISVPFTRNSSTTLSAVINGSTGNASVVVVDNLGNNASFSGNFVYNVQTAGAINPSAGTTNTSVTLTGTNLENTSTVFFGQKSANINLITSTNINVSAPAGTGNVSVIIRDILGNNVSMPGNFRYQNPTITAVAPNTGTLNTPIVITGTNMTNTSFVRIGGINTSFVTNSSVSIQTITPNMSGNVSLVIVDNVGNITNYAGTFGYRNSGLSGFTPISGIKNTLVTISGDLLSNTSFVRFGNVNASIRSIAATSVNVSAPAATGNVSISVIDKFGNSLNAPGTFFYQYPSVTSISPSTGTTSTPVVITGMNLTNTKTIKFGSLSVTKFTINSSSSINVSAPKSSGNINVSLVVIDNFGNNTSFSGNFGYQNPNISVVSPLVGNFQTPVTINGLHLMNTSFVRFGKVNASIQSINASIVSVLAPSNTGRTTITVGDTVGNILTYNVPFIYQTTTISNVTPISGTKNMTLNIVGTNLNNTSYVTIGNISTEFQLNSSVSIQTIVPDSSGNVSVILIDNFGRKTQFSKKFSFTNTTLSPLNASGPPRINVAIKGTNLLNTSVVKFGNVSTTFRALLNSINASVPNGTGNVSVEVIDRFGNSKMVPGNFLYKVPGITQISSDSSPTNTTLSIYGINLSNTSFVSFGSSVTRRLTKTSNLVNVSVPIGNGNVSLVVTDIYGNNTSYRNNFIFQNTFISSITPTSSPPKSELAIQGGYFLNTSAVLFGTLNASYSIQSDSLINVSVPNSSGNVSLTIRDNIGNVTFFPGNFTYKTMTVQDFSPLFGAKNIKILLNGNELSSVVSVKFGIVDASFTIISNYQIEVVAPEITSPSRITITDSYGNTAISPQNFTRKNPLVTGTDKSSGLIGEPFSIYGTDLSVMNYVVFGTEQAANVVATDTEITCIVPYGIGEVSLQVIDNNRNILPITGTFTYVLDVPKANLILQNAPNFTTIDSSNNIYSSSGTRVNKNNTLFYNDSRPISGIAIDGNILYMCEYLNYSIARYNFVTQVKQFYTISIGDKVQPNIIKVYKGKLYAICNADPSTTDPDFLYIFDISANTMEKRSLLPAYTFQGIAIYNTTIYFSAVIKNSPSLGRICKANLSGVITDESLITNLDNPIDLIVINGKLYIDGNSVILYDLDNPTDPLAVYQSDPTSQYNSVFHGTDASGNSVIYMANTTTNTLETISAPSVVTTAILATEITPSVGSENTHVLITGQNFLADDLTPKISGVLFQSVPANNVTIVSSTLLYCDVPEGGGRAAIKLVDMSSNQINTFLFFVYQTPTILDHYPKQSIADDILYIYGKYMNLVTNVLIGTNEATFELIRIDYLRVIIPAGSGSNQAITLIDTLNNNVTDPTKTFSYYVYNSNICFPAGTLVKSDQGQMEIQHLRPGKHTIHGEEILAITGTYSLDKDLVCIEKDAFRKNYPYKQTFVSPRHKIYYKGKMKAAYRLVGKRGVYFVPYTGQKLYNVLLNEHATMNVHGMICETLHPNNPAAKFYREKLIDN